ncbi:MAG: cyclic pyranopterin monophosphate synthase MoaC [Bacteroidales bacterium]|jgi:cyclic pyranopterin phosphate synthase|nr:cyclic pyranopterin monophosphate synthase MoaC [Bacteroidales bacterium]
MKKLTHTDAKGKANMVDVTSKPDQIRQATAEGFIHMNTQALSLVRENNIKKGDVLTVAEIAGIQAGKKTSELIPLCHPLPLTKIAVETSVEETGIRVKAMTRCTGKTGVEMEALTAVSVALLTIYDMCKAVDKQMVIDQIKLVEKSKI